jgi:acetolactate synthase-1/2/3 large subunit
MALFAGVAKFIRKIDDPKRVDDYIDMAMTAANTGKPGPVVLLLPADVLRGPAAEAPFPRTQNLGHFPLDRTCAGREAVAAAADALASAKAPIAIAGGGVHTSDACAALADFIETAQIPVFTTNMGKGAVDETHPLSGGVQGALNGPGSLARHTQPMLDGADVVLLIGTRTNQNGSDNWKIYPTGATFIHIDIDPMEIGRTYEALRLQGDARETLQALTEAMKTRDLSTRAAKRPEIEVQISEAGANFETDRLVHTGSNASPIRPERVMAELEPLLPPEAIVVADASYSSRWIVGQLKAKASGTRIITPRGLAGLGWGMPMGIGAAVARPDVPVIALVGDGGFAHSWAELETAVRMDIPLITIVLNNGILGFQKHAETVKFGAWTSAVHFDEVDHAAIARAVGMHGVRVDAVGDIAPALKEALASGKPRVIEIVTTPDAYPALSLFAKGVGI